ncbi:zinc ribbon domain-containing protein [Tengunoibacter tsumagoiensis]|uniref:Uncharacterized protein n=1 Tax=Tengunoibacter tsumagoiensis TaxID=2014871 RepID=A0A402A5B9_9CHLR|nr:zinc ribbon domain-containing protein [Tengunoibacter tsumagoiensis]GCE14337.1 hypothetical protein KTT_41960 [Tengunoibacter tsumagoiensis]
MFCTYCHAARIENDAPCPNCGAPSPFVGRAPSGPAGNVQANPWNPTGTGSNTQWSAQAPQLSFDQSAPSWPPTGSQTNWQSPPNQWGSAGNWPINNQTSGVVGSTGNQWGSSSNWQQSNFSAAPASGNPQTGSLTNSVPSWQQLGPLPSWQQSDSSADHGSYGTQQQAFQDGPPATSNALLPALYNQPGLEQDGRRPTLSLQLVPEHHIAHLVQPAEGAEKTYVPPMFTQPRPIIPRYRAISGLLSIIIVTLLLCTGVGYFAKTHGAGTIYRQITGSTPNNLAPTPIPNLPDPPNKIDTGPAADIIPSATTASRIDNKTLMPLERQVIFTTNTPFYLSYSVQAPDKDGIVYSKWYTNNQFFITQQQAVKANANNELSNTMLYKQPAEGMVEIYWNDQLAKRLYFVVR